MSGFCGLLYQVVWLRMAFAAFGVITPVLSVVLSVFMLGLALGSWIGGRAIDALSSRTHTSPIIWYGLIEFCIGIGGIVVPWMFRTGESHLLLFGAMDSFRYLLFSALILGLSILPWCIGMGATFPFMMAYIRNRNRSSSESSFSFLYLANVIGAMGGTLLTAFALIEWMGFRNTSLVAAGLNGFVAATALALGIINRPKSAGTSESKDCPPRAQLDSVSSATVFIALPLLFITGLVSMAMEVVWTRAFTPVLHTTIYSFASLLATYLFATWVGSLAYRRRLAANAPVSTFSVVAWLSVFALMPVLLNDPRLSLPESLKTTLVLASIFPFCGTLGFLTPQLIDSYSCGNPRKAGIAYAVNTVGCIIGPLLAGYILLPFMGVRHALILLALPLAVMFTIMSRQPGVRYSYRVLLGSLWALSAMAAFFFITSYEDGARRSEREVRRDHVATVISQGSGMDKRLLVNGIGMTTLTPITKVMAHLPLASLGHKPSSALVICLGMGTTFRSIASWGIDAVAVELVPGVKDAFGYYFDDASEILNHPNCLIVVDDGRRFLKRTNRLFDVIAIDPPPPVEASGSSLLYSGEFYQIVKEHLSSGGILQQWIPGGESRIIQAATRSLTDAFPHVRVFRSIEDWGFHFLASQKPIAVPQACDFIQLLPPAAAADLLEWSGGADLDTYATSILSREVVLEDLLNRDTKLSITDDRPYNEYYFVRRTKYKIQKLFPGLRFPLSEKIISP